MPMLAGNERQNKPRLKASGDALTTLQVVGCTFRWHRQIQGDPHQRRLGKLRDTQSALMRVG